MRRLVPLLFPLLLAVPAPASEWPGLRGPAFDGAVPDVRLFGEAEPALSVGWKVKLGSGYSAPVVADGLVAAMFADGDADYLAAFDVASGEECWRYRIADTYSGHDGSHDGPISTPTIGAGRIYGLGAWGQLFAVDAASGKEIWVTHLVDDVGAGKPWYGFASSPRLVDGVVIVLLSQIPPDPDDPQEEEPPAKPMAVAGFDAATGKSLWIVGDDHVEYQSATPATLAGVPQVLAAGQRTLYSLEPRTGRVLWSFEHGGDERAMGGLTIVPLVAGENRVFLMNKIDSSVMLRVEKKGERWDVGELWSDKSLSNTYVPPVYHDGAIYGMNNRIFSCIDAATGEIRWRSREPGDGFPILVGDQLVMMTKAGSLHVIDASTEGYHEVASLDLFEENSWSEPVFADGYLFARSMGHLARIDPGKPADAGGDVDPWFAGTVLGRFLAELDGRADKADRAAAIDAFLAAHPQNPIVSDDGTAHFLFRGEAQDVGIVGDMIGVRREDPMIRVPGTDLFHYTARLEPTAAATYGFIPDYGEPEPDPRNPRRASGLFGDVSWFAMPAWDAPDFLDEAPAASRGRLETVEWESAIFEGRPRKAEVYLPVGYDAGDARYPTVYVHFGRQALEAGGMKNALDHLLGRRVRPLIAVFVDEDEENPRRDINDDRYVQMVTGELVPRIDAAYRTIPEAVARATVGSGRCASRALRFAFDRPDLFGRVGAQSALTGMEEFSDLAEKGADARPLVIYMDWGTYHMRSPHEAWSLVENNREVWDALRKAGYRPAGGEVPEGFGWPIWAGHIDELLAALFPVGG